MLPRDDADVISTDLVFAGATLGVGLIVGGAGFLLRGRVLCFLEAAFPVTFLERVPEVFLAFFTAAFFALFFFVVFAVRLLFFTRFFAAALAPRSFCDLRVFPAFFLPTFCLFEELFFGVATTNSFDTSSAIVGIDNRRRDYRVASAS